MAALAGRGLRVAPFKVGPDFIDPGHHGAMTGAVSRNLDGWMLPEATNRALFAQAAGKADVAVVEGVMGLFDGYDGGSEAGSTAQMAKWLGLPVLLVVSARSMARSVAALVLGFERFDPALSFAGVVFNHLGSPRHLRYLQEAMAGTDLMPVLGGIPREAGIAIPERHLGLLTREDHPGHGQQREALADLVEAHMDLDALLERLPEIRPEAAPPPLADATPPSGVRIAVARDRAFCFYYQDNLDLLAASGATLIPFSPLEADRLPEGVAGLYLGGGYPELHARRLSGRKGLLAQIREQSAAGMPIYGECGGFMYLCRELTDPEGTPYSMAGCFPFRIRMLDRLKALGYREITLSRPGILGPAGTNIRGHEFHYSEIAAPDRTVETVYGVTDGSGGPRAAEGYRRHNTLGSYVHLHFGSRPETAAHFVAACRHHAENQRIY
jgi:cobyrinic acid a,c-diamide synthase